VGPGGQFIPYTRADAYNFAPTNYFQRPDERWTAGEFMHLNITDSSQVYSEFMFMHDTSIAQIAPGGAFYGTGTAVDPASGLPNGASQVNCNNPFLTPSELTALCHGSTSGVSQFLFGRRDVEGGTRDNDLEHTSFRLVVGVKGKLADGVSYDTYFQEGRTEYSNSGSGNFSKQALQNALNVVTGPSGTPVCQSAAVGCVPYNPWVPGGVTQAALAYVDIPTILTGNTEERIWDGNITVDLGARGFKLPGSESGLIVNLGSQWRSEAATLHPDAPDVNFDVSGNGSPILPLNAGMHVWEGYLEAGMPLLTDRPGAKELSVETGYRYSAYDVGFDTNTYKFGINWAPTSDVRLRASYQRAVRAPNLQELFTQKVVALEGSSDPCASTTGGAPLASLQQCLRTGVNAPGTNTPLLTQYGHLIPNSAGQYNGATGGNPHLQPEKSDTTSLGIVFTPSAIPGLALEADYFDIKIKDVINSYGFGLIMNACLHNGPQYFCDVIHRDSNGTLWASTQGYINDPILNLGSLENKGLDVSGRYNLDVGGLGKLGFSLYGTYTADLIVEPGGLLGTASYDCAGYFGNTCNGTFNVPSPKWKHKLRMTYDTPVLPGAELGLQWRYLGSVVQDTNSPNPLLHGSGKPPAEIPSFSYFDVTVSYRVDKNVNVLLGCNNLFDKDPPFLSGTYFSGFSINANTYPQVYDYLGRYLFANVTLQF
jgi:outer membrane receptor protein involved in Fe transport